ncbi:MAG: aspartyl/asparaginyl beta-hydroxylase domain-containing protein [Planctomycetaceae bacterium]|nr:aspartyl/asparaginyl beta-hydroxylase domain-containing protein [Planctomycetaceae bacterium]
MVEKPKTIRELGPVDIAEIKSLVLKTSDHVWDLCDRQKENKFFCFHDTAHIVFRFTPGNRSPKEFYSTPVWNFWAPFLLPIMNSVTEVYGYSRREFPKVMLARLKAGQVIDRHVDGAGSNLQTHKIHVPLFTNERARMYIQPHEYHLREGFAYEVNNIVSHGVENFGDTDRIHLIFECFDAAVTNGAPEDSDPEAFAASHSNAQNARLTSRPAA